MTARTGAPHPGRPQTAKPLRRYRRTFVRLGLAARPASTARTAFHVSSSRIAGHAAAPISLPWWRRRPATRSDVNTYLSEGYVHLAALVGVMPRTSKSSMIAERG